jgi:hypothetical protein
LAASLLALFDGLWQGLYQAAAETQEETQENTQMCRRLVKGVRTRFWKKRCDYACLLIVVVGVQQTKTALCSPGESILPIEWITETALPINGTPNCSFHSNWKMAQAFFANSSVDFSTISLTIPKVSHPYSSDALAMADESNIYLLQDACEVSTATLVHELAHVWQFQTASIFQLASVDQLITWPWSCKTWECKYDFGGEAGLQNILLANPHAQITAAFGIEQQAEIIATYYSFRHAGWRVHHNNSYHDLLRYFALQVLSK